MPGWGTGSEPSTHRPACTPTPARLSAGRKEAVQRGSQAPWYLASVLRASSGQRCEPCPCQLGSGWLVVLPCPQCSLVARRSGQRSLTCWGSMHTGHLGTLGHWFPQPALPVLCLPRDGLGAEACHAGLGSPDGAVPRMARGGEAEPC